MTVSYGYYLPLAENIYQEVRFLDIAIKTEGLGAESKQATTREGTPKWTVSALVKYEGGKQETETFTLSAPQEIAEKINTIPELTTIKLVGLAAGKWSRSATDKTSWSFQITGIEVVK
ncbi:hypothetical protein [Aurantimicrobium minutum]|uniref:hypothetical protein n=1 Tax=Aurantimicrobium minutum TaxID=708131 RepID=UPI0024738156|nr:hypothetical protein [Aurantimicrobium minutum]MDH6238617.1 phosphoribosylamine-glycine ligase [Aurantimicrobium minutum]